MRNETSVLLYQIKKDKKCLECWVMAGWMEGFKEERMERGEEREREDWRKGRMDIRMHK